MLASCPQILGHYNWGRIRVFPIVQDGHKKSFPKLDDLYEGDRLRPDAKEKQLELLYDV